MTDRHKAERAQKVAASILEDPELAFLVGKKLNAARIAGPWEKNAEMRLLGRMAPTAPGMIRRFVCNIEFTGSHYEWKVIQGWDLRVPQLLGMPIEGGDRYESGKSTTLYTAMKAADRRLRGEGWTLVGEPLVTDHWEGRITKDAISGDVVPGSLRRHEAETGGEIVAIRWGDVTTKDGDEVEGLLLDSPAIEELRGRVIEKGHDESWDRLIVRGQKLVDDTLRRLGWMVGMD